MFIGNKDFIIMFDSELDIAEYLNCSTRTIRYYLKTEKFFKTWWGVNIKISTIPW
jgi:transcriptional antiterminator